MELKDIATTCYELMRIKQDRDSMYYEDLLSHSQRLLEDSIVKYKKLKMVIYKQKQVYDHLVEKVSLILPKKDSHQSTKQGEKGKGHVETSNKRPFDKLGSSSSSSRDWDSEQPVKKNTKQFLKTSDQDESTETNGESPILYYKSQAAEVAQQPKENISTITISPQLARGSDLPLDKNNDKNGFNRSAKVSGNSDRDAKKIVEIVYVDESSQENESPAKKTENETNLDILTQTPDASRRVLHPVDNNILCLDATSTSSSTAKAVRPDPAKASRRPSFQNKCIEVVRNREERAAMPGFACTECEQFYKTMLEQGIITDENRGDFLQSCSRHKARWTPPSTPEGFWDLSLHTPAGWK
eukprot:gene313-335_t